MYARRQDERDGYQRAIGRQQQAEGDPFGEAVSDDPESG